MDELRVLLVGGAPGVGKTTLARGIASRLGFASTSGDDLVVVARSMTTSHSHPDVHRVGAGGHTTYFTDGPPERLIEDAVALQDAMWPVFERVVRRHVEDRAPLVVDWWLLAPSLVGALDEPRIASIWLHADPGLLDRRERALTWFRRGSSDEERMHANFMHRSLWRNRMVATEARSLGLPIVDQPGGRTATQLVDEALSILGRTHRIPQSSGED